MGAGALSQPADAAPRVIGLVAALPVEAQGLAGRLEPGAGAPLAGTGRMRLCGIGSSNARSAAIALADSGVTALLSWGSAGGLDPRLRPGDLIVPELVLSADGRRFPVATDWRAQVHGLLSRQLETHAGVLVQSLKPVTTPQQKRDLFNRTGAVVVDMESTAVAEVAALRGLPFVAIRAVLDPASRALPQLALVAVDNAGRLRARELLRGLLRHPLDLAGIAQLLWDLRAASAALAAAARLAELHRSPGAGG
jgi:adenosylhomocysteine nucleosidase